MKKNIIIVIGLLFSSGLFAQGIYNNGAKIAVGTGTYLTIGGANGNYRNETNVTNGSVDLTGTFTLTGNVTNNVAGADVFGTAAPGGLVVLNGTTAQSLGGTTIAPFVFPNLTINNAAGIILSNNAQVNGTVTFTNGLLNIGNSNFTFGSTAVVAGTPSTTSMIVATGTGQVQKIWSGAFTFPIGDNNGTAKYSPVSLNFTAGSFAAGAQAGVNVVNAKYNDPSITGSYINRYWNITQTGITGFSCNAVLQYLPSDVTGTESNINGLRVLPTPYTVYNPANTVLHQLSITGLTSFGTFTGGNVDKTLTLDSVMLEGLYAGKINGIRTMRQAMGVSLPQWPVGVADHITVELHSALVGSYATVLYTAIDVPLSITGTATVIVPGTFNGSYFITIKHRNGLQTVSANAQSFAGTVIKQSFGLPANVYKGNLVQMTDLSYTIYTGDVNQDNIIDLSDATRVDNMAATFKSGYIPEDVNGDGLIDLSDATIIDNNASLFVGAITP